MPQFFVIDQIEIGHEGPLANGPKINKKPQIKQLIHLAQGSMDGACGPYSVMMALLISGMIDRNDLVDLRRVDGRTNAGKLLNMLQKYQGFFRNGTDTDELKKMLTKSYGSKIRFVSKDDECGCNIRDFVKDHLDNNHPVMLWLAFPQSLGHWVVAIGYEYQEELDSNRRVESQDELEVRASRKPLRFLLLDPDEERPIISAWNGVVDSVGSKGPYPYVWWGHDIKAKYVDALAFCLKK